VAVLKKGRGGSKLEIGNTGGGGLNRNKGGLKARGFF